MSGEHGRSPLARRDKGGGDQRGICRETNHVLTDRAKPVLAARNPFNSIVMRRAVQLPACTIIFSAKAGAILFFKRSHFFFSSLRAGSVMD